ncbi:hypothetical protein M0R72_09030 [Candidatus Pacearchaeota archaeon]|jgi:hypothetical protein|nr:hypothetical protein [Candidatus Pacearchaeota archaeon]
MNVKIKDSCGTATMAWQHNCLYYNRPIPNDLAGVLAAALDAYEYFHCPPDYLPFDAAVAAWIEWKSRRHVTVTLENHATTGWRVIIMDYIGGQPVSSSRMAAESVTGSTLSWHSVLFACGACAFRFNAAFATNYTLTDLRNQLRRAYECALDVLRSVKQ